jgi:hypothetical protein
MWEVPFTLVNLNKYVVNGFNTISKALVPAPPDFLPDPPAIISASISVPVTVTVGLINIAD